MNEYALQQRTVLKVYGPKTTFGLLCINPLTNVSSPEFGVGCMRSRRDAKKKSR